METTLAPVSPPVGIYPEFCLQQATSLVIRDKIASVAGDAAINDLNGIPRFILTGQAFSAHSKKDITDPQGRLLYRLAEKLIHMPAMFWAEDGTGRQLFTMKGQWSLTPKMHATFPNTLHNGAETTISLQRSGVGGAADIHLGEGKSGPLIAQIHRDFGHKGDLTGAHTFVVNIAPGVDTSLVTAIAVLFEEARDESRRVTSVSAM